MSRHVPMRAPRRRALALAIVAPLIGSAISARVAISATSIAPAAPSASASISLDRCADAAEKAQFARLHGHLVEAREELLACTRPECPTLVVRDCTNWFTAVDKALPTVVVSARDELGGDLTAARVLVDGAVVATTLDGRAIAIDPGQHALRVECEGHTAFAQSILVIESEKDRRIEAILTRADASIPTTPAKTTTVGPTPTTTTTTTRSITAPLIFGSIGALSLASWGYFGIGAVNRYHALRDSCGSACDPSDVHALEVRSAIADVSLGVGALAIGAAAWTWIAGAPSGDATTPTLSFAPTPGGAIGWVGGRF